MNRVGALASGYVAMLVAILQGVITAYLLAKYLPISEYGAWAQFRALSGLATTFFSLNLGHAYLRFAPAASPTERVCIFRTVVITQLIVATLGWLLFLPLSSGLSMWLFERPELSLFLFLYPITILAIFQVQSSNGLIVQQRPTVSYSLNTLSRIASIIGIAIAAYFVGTLFGVLWALLSVNALTAVVVTTVARKSWGSGRVNFSALFPLLKFALPLFPVQLSLWICTSSDRFFLKYYSGLEMVAQYSLIYAFAGMIHIIYSAVSAMFLETLVRRYSEEHWHKLSSGFVMAVRWYWAIGLSLCVAVFVGARGLITLIATHDYLFAGAEWVAINIAVGSFLFGLYQIYSRLYDLEKRTIEIGTMWVVAALLNLVLNALLIPRYDMLGAAIATALAYGTTLILALWRRPQFIDFPLPKRRMLAYTIGIAILIWAANGLQSHSDFRDILAAGVIATAAFVLAMLLRLIRYQDVQSFLAQPSIPGEQQDADR